MALISTALLAISLFSSPSAKLQNPPAIDLGRKFTPGQRLSYQVRSAITTEIREKGLQTWLPSDIEFSYDFTLDVEKLKTDGIAVVRYQRPNIVSIEDDGEGRKRDVDKLDQDVRLTLSPINEVLDNVPVPKPKKTPAKKPGKKSGGGLFLHRNGVRQPLTQTPIFGEFISEVYRLALFIGSLDSSLDLSPRLPFEETKVGDTWQRTVGYQPQKLKGKDGKSAVQRLDYTYVYQGPKQVNGKPVLRIQAKLDFKTDLVDFLKSILDDAGIGGKVTNIEAFPLAFKSTIDFDLDPVSHNTIRAIATTEGGYRLTIEEIRDEAIREERFKGRSTLSLVSITKTPAPKK